MRGRLSIDPYPKYFANNQMPSISTTGRKRNGYSFTQNTDQKTQNSTQFISMVDDYLTRRIDFVNQSRSNEVKQLTRIKNSLQQKLGEIKVNPEDIPYKRSTYSKPYEQAKPTIMGSMRRKYEQKAPNRALDMVSFETQIHQCDRLLNDLGVKCREYASVESVKNQQPMRYKIKTEIKNEPEERQMKLPLLKAKRATTQQVYNQNPEVDHPFHKKYDHSDEACLVVPISVQEGGQHRKSEVPTSRHPYLPTRSRKSSMDNKSLVNASFHKKRQLGSASHKSKQDHQTIEHKRKKSMTIDIDTPHSGINNRKVRDSMVSFSPKKVKHQIQTIDKAFNTNDSYIRSHQILKQQSLKDYGTQNDFAKSQSEHGAERKSTNEVRQEKQPKRAISRSKQQQKQQQPKAEQKKPQKQRSRQWQRKSRQQVEKPHSKSHSKSHSNSKDSKQSNHNQRKSPCNLKQKSIIPQLSMAKMRGLKLYQRIKQYKSKASVK